jgi:hypothetical protein
MDCPAALHRLVVGVPATVEHSAEAGAGEGEEIGKWVAETTQVGRHPLLTFYCLSVVLMLNSYRLPTPALYSLLRQTYQTQTPVIHHLYGRPKTKPPSQRPAPPLPL